MLRPISLLAVFLLANVSPPLGRAAAQDRPVTTRMLVEIKDLSSVAISPDGAYVAFREERASIEDNSYRSAWRVRRLDDDGTPIRVADGGAPLRNGGLSINEPPQWSPDSHWIYYRALLDGEVQIWRAARDGGKAERLTSDAADIEAFVLDPGASALIYRVGATREEIVRAEEDEYAKGVLFDDSIFAGQGLFRSVLINGRLASERTDDRMIRRQLLWDAPKRVRVLDLNTGAVREAADREAERLRANDPAAGLAVRSPSGDLVAIISETPEGKTVLRVSRAGLEKRPMMCGACADLKIVALAWRNDDELIITSRDAERGYAQSLYVWRPEDDALRLVARSDGLLSGDRSGKTPCAIGEHAAVCVAAEAAAPPRLVSIPLDGGPGAVLYEPNARLAAAMRGSVDVEFLAWTDKRGRRFTGHLFTPKAQSDAGPLPLFVTYYVCPGFLRGGFGDEWPLIPMAQAGVAALCVNARLPGREARDAKDDYQTGLEGVTAAADLLAARGFVDRRNIGMGGLSFGSEVTLWTASHSDLLAAASVASSAASPTWYWFRSMQAGFAPRAREQWGLGTPEETPDRWRELSPAFYPEEFTAPILMQMAEQEYRSVIEYYARMRRAGVPVELWAYPHEPHIKFQPRHKLSVYDRNLDWFRFWLLGSEDPDPGKADQYERWRKLKRQMHELSSHEISESGG